MDLGTSDRSDALRAIHVTGFPVLDARILAGFQQRRQEGVFAIEADQHDQVRPVHHRDEARFHRHAVRVFDAGRETANFNEIAADVAGEIRQVSERSDDADFGRVRRHDRGHARRTTT